MFWDDDFVNEKRVFTAVFNVTQESERGKVIYIEDITRWCEDINFIFEWQNNIYQRAQRVSKIPFLPRENKIHIFKPSCNVLFIMIQTK